MTSNQYRELRNKLEMNAIFCNIYSKEYRNLIVRKNICTRKAQEQLLKEIWEV